MTFVKNRVRGAKLISIVIAGMVIAACTACAPKSNGTAVGNSTVGNQSAGNPTAESRPSVSTMASSPAGENRDERAQPTNKSLGETPGGG